MAQEVDHAKYSASATHRWFECPGSIRLCENIPDRSSPEAMDGTEAHTLLEFCLMGGIRKAGDGYFGGQFKFEFRRDDLAIRLDAVQEALDYVYEVLDRFPEAELHIEVRVQFPSKAAPGEAFGTADIVILVPSLGTMFVFDYKHGAGVAVEIVGNTQIRTYAVSALVKFDPTYSVYHTVHTAIIQPRAFHANGAIREDTIFVMELLDFIDTFDAKVEATKAYDAPLVVGDVQCKFCPAKPVCPAREAHTLKTLGAHFTSVRDITVPRMPVPTALPLERISYILQARGIINNWFDAVEAHAFKLSMDGVYIPDYKVVEAQAKREWDEDKDEIAEQLMLYLGTMDEDEVRPRKLLTITEMEAKLKAFYRSQVKLTGKKGKQAGKEAAEEATKVLAQFTTKQSSGKLSLVHSSDPRPSVDRARRDFQALQLTEVKD